MAGRLTLEEFIRILESYETNFRHRKDEIPYEFKTSIVRQVIRTRSIDTRRFIRAIDSRFIGESVLTGNFRYQIDTQRDSDVTYDGYVEFEGITRNWIGRFNYRDGIRNADIERITDSIADQTFLR